MKIAINGDITDQRDGLTVAELIEGMGLGGTRFAVELNSEILPRSVHRVHRLKEGDRIEVVRAIGGG